MNAASVLAASIGKGVQQYYCLAGIFGIKLELSMQLLHLSCRLVSVPIPIGENGSIPPPTLTCTVILEQSMEPSGNRVVVPAFQATQVGGQLGSYSVPSPQRLF